MSCVVVVRGLADGGRTPHDDRYVVRWNQHTRFGTCDIDTTAEREKAKHFTNAGEVFAQWKTTSQVQPRRRDGKPNRPLTGLTIEIIKDE